MLKDRYNRKIDYLRISVTDRCNLRCRYCMPQCGVIAEREDEILTFDEMKRVVRAGIHLGIDKIKITGGEPLMRKGISKLIRMLLDMEGIKDLSITTNGIRLKRLAKDLKDAGLERLNVSLDSLDENRYRYITRGGSLGETLGGIEKAIDVGLSPVKLNVVVMRDINVDEIPSFLKLSERMPVLVRFIELMPTKTGWFNTSDHFISINEIKNRYPQLRGAAPTRKTRGCGPAEYYQVEGMASPVGFIGSVSSHFCDSCSRLRLTANGRLRPCLHSNLGIDLRYHLRRGADLEEISQILKKAAYCKPLQADYNSLAIAPAVAMSEIGG